MDRKYSTRVISAVRYCLALAGIAVIGVVPAARARVTTLIINDTQPAFGGASFGSVGTYEVITGTFTDEVAPNDPHDAVITDIGLGPKNPTERSASRRISKLSGRPTWRIRPTG